MPSARNIVIAGAYQNKAVSVSNGRAYIMISFFKSLYLDKSTIASYQLVDETTKISTSSALGRAAVGSLILGPVGLVAGLGAKTKRTHTLSIQFKDGRRSLLEVDDKVYKAIMIKAF